MQNFLIAVLAFSVCNTVFGAQFPDRQTLENQLEPLKPFIVHHNMSEDFFLLFVERAPTREMSAQSLFQITILLREEVIRVFLSAGRVPLGRLITEIKTLDSLDPSYGPACFP